MAVLKEDAAGYAMPQWLPNVYKLAVLPLLLSLLRFGWRQSSVLLAASSCDILQHAFVLVLLLLVLFTGPRTTEDLHPVLFSAEQSALDG
mmetsp:Transcript_96260/g.167175  ORF Transcript_96260/g.167175 Transcript_96260/m.167175 type:complete len:90 (+) Transcript_96260:122-391(+)